MSASSNTDRLPVAEPSTAIIFVAVLASLLEIIDTSIVNVALPTMMGNLGATLEDISMVITGYAIANAVVLPLSGWLGERFGRRKYYLGCILAFTAASVACGLAPNLFFLTVFRILQGLAGGALLPTSQALIYEQFPKEKAGIAGAIFGMSVMIGPTLGPTLGGYLTDQFGWRSIFNINLPLGLAAFFVGMNYIFDRKRAAHERTQAEDKATFDGVGFGLLVAGIGCLQYVLERGEADDWFSSTGIVVNSIIAAVSLPGFIWWELKVKDPIINLRLFKRSVVTNGVLLQAGLGFFLYGLIFLLPIFVSTAFHYTATQIGLLFIPGSLLTAFMMPFVGKQMARGTNPKILITMGLLSIVACIFVLTTFSPQTSRTDILGMLFIRGLGMAFLFVPINSSILSQFTGAELGQVSGLLNLCRQIGGSAGIALIGTLLTSNNQQNYLDLISHVSLLNPNTQFALSSSLNGMALKMSEAVGMTMGNQAALKAIAARVHAQVFMMSFHQLIYVIGAIFSLTFIPLYLIQFTKKTTVVSDAH